jgi:hypothetical protein
VKNPFLRWAPDSRATLHSTSLMIRTWYAIYAVIVFTCIQRGIALSLAYSIRAGILRSLGINAHKQVPRNNRYVQQAPGSLWQYSCVAAFFCARVNDPSPPRHSQPSTPCPQCAPSTAPSLPCTRTLSVASTTAPALSSAATTSRCPAQAVLWRGVRPSCTATDPIRSCHLASHHGCAAPPSRGSLQ